MHICQHHENNGPVYTWIRFSEHLKFTEFVKGLIHQDFNDTVKIKKQYTIDKSQACIIKIEQNTKIRPVMTWICTLANGDLLEIINFVYTVNHNGT